MEHLQLKWAPTWNAGTVGGDSLLCHSTNPIFTCGTNCCITYAPKDLKSFFTLFMSSGKLLNYGCEIILDKNPGLNYLDIAIKY